MGPERVGDSGFELSGAALSRYVKVVTLISLTYCFCVLVFEVLNGATTTVLVLRSFMVLGPAAGYVAFSYLPQRATWTIVQLLAISTTALLAGLALADPNVPVIRLAALAVPAAVAAALTPNTRTLPIVLGFISAVAGSFYLSKLGRGVDDIARWVALNVMVAAFSFYGAARYLRLWSNAQTSLRQLTHALSAAAADLVAHRDERAVLDAVLGVLRSQGFTASFEPAASGATDSERNARLSNDGLVIPVLVEDTRYGVLRVQSPSVTPSATSAIELFARHVGGAIANIHHHQRAAQRLEELRGLQRELVARERLAVLGEAAAVVSHEVRNPLGAILNSTYLLKRSAQAGGRDQELLRMIEEEATRLERLVHDLLILAKPLEPKFSPLNLGELCERVSHSIRQQPVFANVLLAVKADADTPIVKGDAGYLQVAVENLLRNAAQASPPSGIVRLTVERTDGGARLIVEDDGPGIPQEALEKLFLPFFTTRVTGTGLGLPVVKRIADAHGAPIEVLSAPPRGTRFAILLKTDETAPAA